MSGSLATQIINRNDPVFRAKVREALIHLAQHWDAMKEVEEHAGIYVGKEVEIETGVISECVFPIDGPDYIVDEEVIDHALNNISDKLRIRIDPPRKSEDEL